MKNIVKLLSCAAATLFMSGGLALSQTSPPAEIKLGQTMPYSGPASAYSIVGRVQLAYFNMVNEQGGVNGRKIKLISLDDAFSPPKAVEQVRKLVEEDEVLAIFSMLGTPSNVAVSKYLNERHVPQVLSNTGSSLLDNPKDLPWTTIFSMPFRTEAWITAAYLLKTKPDAKIGVIYQNDEFGRGFLKYFKQGLGAKAATMVVKEASYDITSPTVDSQVLQLKTAGADTILNSGTPKFAAQVIRKVHELDWKPLHLVLSASSSVESVLRPAGLEAAKDLISTQFIMSPEDPLWANDPGMMTYHAFMKKWAPNEKAADPTAVNGFISSYIMVEILKKCGNDLSRENILKQANSFPEVPMPGLIPGVKYNATAENHTPFHEAQPVRFDGERWVPVADVIRAVVPSGE